jgi:hypothetical protein
MQILPATSCRKIFPTDIIDSKTMSMNQPFKMSNQAVFQLEDENYDQAIATLTMALKALKAAMSGDSMVSEAIEAENDGSSFSIECEFRSSGLPSFLETVPGWTNSPKSIFREPIFVTSPLSETAQKDYDTLSYVVLYNLALAHHLRAMQELDPRSLLFRLQKALTLYEHAHQVLMNHEIEVTLMHTMAITSNLGHIQHVLGNESKASMCFQHLLSTILYVVDCGEGQKLQSLDGFFRNVMNLVAKETLAPAA